MHKRIQRICGESEIIPDFDAIGNNPNFVFTNDPNFDSLTLFNENGNTVMVNSWLECANYVNGGWSIENLNSYNGELIIFIITLGICGVFWIFKRINRANVTE